VSLRRLVGPFLVLVVLGGVAFVGAFPTRTYLAQRQTMAESNAQLSELNESNAAAQAEVDRLQTDEAVEGLAREQYGLARPNEEVYDVLPEPMAPVEVPDVWPFNKVAPS
jgi:cell division protein FtsB